MIECVSCGRRLVNTPGAENQAAWTIGVLGFQGSTPYCADSDDCENDAYAQLGIETRWTE